MKQAERGGFEPPALRYIIGGPEEGDPVSDSLGIVVSPQWPYHFLTTLLA